ncbi:hypothetical protein SNL152K_10570 [Streptomyces sp. NL15-2K]|nr:hypothetical protein SNL152K_10570 [Streptomyces sp. NL15-2K]
MGVVTVGADERAALDEAQGLHRTAARLVEDTPATPPRFSGPADDRVWTTVRWTMPDGSPKTGEAPVAAGSKVGSSTTVWLDATGRLRPAPPTVRRRAQWDRAWAEFNAGRGNRHA